MMLKSATFSEKREAYLAVAPERSGIAATELVYDQILCPDEQITGTVGKNTISYPDIWKYYKFYGEEGTTIQIKMVRVDCEMDAAYTLFFGTSATTEGIAPMGSSNPDLEYIVFHDDDVAPPAFCEGSCFAFWDPQPTVTLPYTGWYTLGVYDFASCGNLTELDYSLVITDIPSCGCDTEFMGVVAECINTPDRMVTFTYKPEADGWVVIQGGFTRYATGFAETFDTDVFEMAVNPSSMAGVRSFSGMVEECEEYTITVSWQYLQKNKKGVWLTESGHVIDRWTAKLYDMTDPENPVLIREMILDPMWCGDERVGYEPVIE